MADIHDVLTERSYNSIYNELVTEDYDFVGMVAYSLYKQEKYKFIQAKIDDKGMVTDNEIKDFHLMSKIHLNDYNETAVKLIKDFIEEIVKQGQSENFEEIGYQILKKLNHGVKEWLIVILQNIVSSIIIAVGVFIILLMLWFKSSGNQERVIKNSKEYINKELNIPVDSILINN